MFQVTREIAFCYGHRLLDYAGKCRYLHGHNGRAVITLEARSLDPLGMVIDFSQIKQAIQGWIEETLDHKMLLHEKDPLLAYLCQHGEPVFSMKANPTAENIAKLIFDYAVAKGFPVVEVRLWETDNCYASYTDSKARHGQ
jgi:6-pyruvoyltetrahydropterin/6-carboxytetrahydropterin synthase